MGASAEGTGAQASDGGTLGAELDRIEAEVRAGRTDLSGLGFWRIVARLKRDPALADRFADQAGRIDRAAFEARKRFRLPVWLGNAVLLVGVAIGALAIVVAMKASNRTVAGIALVVSAGILSVSVHDLGHWMAGRAVGIRFVCYFLDGPFLIQPGLKTDYATYLRATPSARALMHASGALASKVAPFVSVAFYPASNAPLWALLVTLAIGAVQIVTDIVWSTKKSDWKKVARERSIARTRS
jgi:hypothetical protein